MRTRTLLPLCAAVCLILSGRPQAAPASLTKIQFHLEAQLLSDAVASWSKQSGLQLIWPIGSLKVTSQLAPKVSGLFSPDEALSLLLAGSGLTYSFVDAQTVEIKPVERADAHRTRSERERSVPPLQVPQATTTTHEGVASPTETEPGDPKSSSETKSIDEVVVTGSHIRGASSASPLQIYTRDEIDRTGLGNVQEFVQRLPQNFKGGASEGTVGTFVGGGRTNDQVGGTGVNLRGLGNDSTLVLVNGRRVAPANWRGNYIDVSMIPLSALERVDVVADGASAVYGSDAVGGVINFVLRRDFNGAETRARYGTVTEGNSDTITFAQTVGRTWDDGGALLSYEFFKQTPLDAKYRPYTRATREPFDLLSKQRRHSAFATIHQATASGLDFFLDANFSRRSEAHTWVTEGVTADIGTYGATLGGHGKLTNSVGAELSVSYAESDTRLKNYSSGVLNLDRRPRTNTTTVDAKIDGTILDIPAGSVLFAIGGQFRRDSLEQKNVRSGATFDPSHDVTAAYAEVNIPIVGPVDSESKLNRVELSLADRYERYSDFGSTNNQKVGFVWNVTPTTRLRGTYGTSFKAPLLADLNPVPFESAAYPQFDPRSGTLTNTYVLFGGNAELEPEAAKTWTLGVDWISESVPGLTSKLSYYEIDFTDRIADAQSSGVNVFDALRLEDILGPSIIRRNPSLELLEFIETSPGFADFCPFVLNGATCPIASIGVVVDSRPINLSKLETSGIDFEVDYTSEVSFGRLSGGLAGTYILKYDTQFTANSPVSGLLNTPYNPVDLKLRSHVTLQRGGLGLAAYINYTDSYVNDLGGIYSHVRSWVTGDLTVSYEFDRERGLLEGMSAMLGIINITDQDPPIVEIRPPIQSNGRIPALDYDGANANVLGRFVSFQVSKQF